MEPTRPSAAADRSVTAVRLEQVREVARTAPLSMAASLLTAGLVTLALAGEVRGVELLVWLAVIGALTVIRLWHCVHLRRLSDRAPLSRVFPEITANAAVLALAWLVPSLLWFDAASAHSRIFIMLVHVGVMSAGSRSWGAIPAAATAFVLILGVGLVRITALHGGWTMSALAVVLTFVLCHGIGSAARLFASHVRGRRELEEQGELIARMARRDPLTGLANRLLVREMIDAARLRQRSGGGDYALLLLDLDRFKLVNDSLGHGVGDRLLAEVARRLEETCGPLAGVGRLGGDEFAVVWRGPCDTPTLRGLADRIVRAIDLGFSIGSSAVRIGVSIGIARAPDDGETKEQLMRSADLALYCAKEDRRGGHCFYAPWMLAKATAERLLEQDVREAVGRGDLRLHYQPIIDAGTQRTVGHEALLRWWHPVRGAIGPDIFVPIIEDAGLIHQIGDWVIREACREAAGWPGGQRVAVNVSVAQLTGAGLRETVEQALAESGLAPERLELEVTQSVFLGEDAATLAALGSLQEIGVRLVLDDFGTGASRFACLSRARFAKIKIDRMFVHGAAAGERAAQAIVQSILALAQGLGVETTAEGVETGGQAALMAALGCTELQGYWFGKPVDATRIDHGGVEEEARLSA